ncbi:nuclease-related domain-containing protein [Nocardioides sp. Kera G14]|uniref:nuclease-related domain-containing protein n=1 Tax=Nocardioides sp. Kera G14 TaxID=2884264 RepID=UPI001D102871|nr:nuclease-related domain-containing protein [Nocardioides sp. Kera G14]UDY24902.1 NERD domain-containing protein [Nocardioides sp. Kera G14]
MDKPTADQKRMKLRYAGACRLCGTVLEAGAEAIYERATKTVRCLECLASTPAQEPEPVTPVAPVDAGAPGGSARREFERRQAKRTARIREKHPKLGGFILAVSDDPQTTTAWNTGALGEERLGNRLNQLSSDSMRVLHDRRIPGTKANIDHIAVTPSGIFVIDAKRYVGKRPTLQIEGGLFRPRVEKLLVGPRDQTKLVDGVQKQVDLVKGILDDAEVPVVGVLCFIESDWPLIGGAFTIRGVEVLWPKRLYPRLTADGPHRDAVADQHRRLAACFPSA